MAITAGNMGDAPAKPVSSNRMRWLGLLVLLGLLFLSCNRVLAEESIIAMGPSYAVQAGLYVGPIQANRMAEQLISAGYAAWVEERPQGLSKMLYFVLVGPFSDKAQANEAVGKIASKFSIEPFIVDLNQR